MAQPTEETVSTASSPGRRKYYESGVIGDLWDMVLQIQGEVLDKRDIDHEQLYFMTKNDGHAKGILNAIKYPVKMARPTITEVEGGEKEAEFIKENLFNAPTDGGMDTPLRTVIARMALAVRDGHKIFEKVFKMYKSKIYLKKLAYRSNINTKFKYDKHGEVVGARQKTYFQEREIDVSWGLEKIAYFTYNAEENPYVGESDFYPVFYHYDKKHKLYAIAHIAYQLNAVPIRVGTHPKNIDSPALEAFRGALKQLGTSVAMTVPEDCKVEAFESKRSLHEYLSLIQHHDKMMAMSFLTQFMDLGGGRERGGIKISSDQSNLFLMSLMSLLEDIATVFNTQVIPQLIDWNFGTKKYPVLSFTPFSDAIRSAVMTTFNNLLAARFPQVSQEFALAMESAVADELGLDIDYEAVRARMEEERKKLMEAEASAEPVETPVEGESKSAGKGIKKKAPKGKEEADEDL